MEANRSSRPYWASRWENKFDAIVAALLRRRGWAPRIEPYTGYGLAPTHTSVTAGTVPASVAPSHNNRVKNGNTDSAPSDDADGWVRVLGRVMLAPARRAPADATALPEESASTPRCPPWINTTRLNTTRLAEGAARRRRARSTPEPLRAVRGWRSFLTAQLPGAPVVITVNGKEHHVRADRGGYVDVVLPSRLAQGWQEVTIAPVGGPATEAPVRLIGRQVRVGLVSDVDDTVMVTALPRPLTAVWNLLVLHESARRTVPGMVGLYAEIETLEEQLPVIYLSTNAWNVAAALRRFFAFHALPAGPILLTDWGPTNTGWFRSGREHKYRALRRLADEFPEVRWILVGDDGQHDPQIYSHFAKAYPEHVRAIAIRQLTSTEQVLASGSRTPSETVRSTTATDVAATIPVVAAPDGEALSSDLRAAGVLRPRYTRDARRG
jgi:phosphatidate phosphatase APP1